MKPSLTRPPSMPPGASCRNYGKQPGQTAPQAVSFYQHDYLHGVRRNYKRCTGGKRHFWNCPTAVQTDLPSCGTSQIPEKLLYDLAAQVLGLAQFDEGVFLERVKGIDALPDKTLVFHFYDGSTQSGIGNTYPGPKAGHRK